MTPPVPASLNNQLKGVSRSFYLSMRILPEGMREPIAIAYLLARTADTVADTELVKREDRHAALAALRDAMLAEIPRAPDFLKEFAAAQADASEAALLAYLPQALAYLHSLTTADRESVRAVLATLTTGMLQDLEFFPSENARAPAALPDEAALDRYTYLVAGCVGEFWTDLMCQHAHIAPADLQRLRQLGIHFGQALQLVNILRDLPRDLRIGRCYVPASLLARYGLEPLQLKLPENAVRALPVNHAMVRRALACFGDAVDYTLSIPACRARLRLACLWPIVIGLETLLAHVRNPDWLSPQAGTKISRPGVYRILLTSLVKVYSNAAIRGWCNRLTTKIEADLTPENIVSRPTVS